jgi:kumamolisin
MACRRSTRSYAFLFVFLLSAWLPLAAFADSSPTRLSGHVLPALAGARPAAKSASADDALSLTIVLRRSDGSGFAEFLNDLYDPSSPRFHAFLAPTSVSDRFGPSPDDYSIVRSYFAQQGFAVDADSANRLTMTVHASRSTIESALQTHIADYDMASQRFYANDLEPALPDAIASRVEAIAGLSNLAIPEPSRDIHIAVFSLVCTLTALADFNFLMAAQGSDAARAAYLRALAKCINNNGTAAGYGTLLAVDPPPPAWQGVDGTGQTIGLLEYDSYDASDVSDYVQLIALPASTAAHVTNVPIGGGTTPGANQDEVLLDIADVVSIAPGASVKVYTTAFSGGSSYQAMFNAMINGGVSIISNSWAYCEDQTTSSDVQSIDTILQAAAASGISVFSGSGDSGSTCLDGAANTASVPASAPHLTAVGGTSLTLGAGNTYGTETWWNGANDTPPSGQGGFGTSRFFTRPSYQDGFTSASARSIPDIAANADPAHGVQICAAALGGCPTNAYYGGTSSSTPIWAAFTALLNQSQGQNLGFLNPALYPLGATNAFHSGASMGSDFAHVGLGSPNLARLHQRLTSQSFGSVDASVSQVQAYGDGNFAYPLDLDLPIHVTGDGVSHAWIAVRVADGNGNPGGGLPVTLTPSAGSHAVISPPNGTANADTGAIVFAVTDTTLETVAFTATANGTVIAATPSVEFVAPPAASAGIMAFPTTVAADGVSTTTITVTLRDVDNHPTPGKTITLAQGEGRSVITSPDPPVTDANGEIAFIATDRFEEAISYTATDVTDGNLPVPGTADVTFTGAAVGSCATPPTAADGYAFTAFINGFSAEPFFYGNTNFGCAGVSPVAFDATGNAYVVYFPTGAFYRFGPEGGTATAPLSTLGPTLSQPVFGRDGRLYATHSVTTGDFTTGDLVEIDPETGAQLRVLATNLTCPQGLATDPLSGDLFFDDACTGAGSDNPSIFRVNDPASATPTVSVYATMPASPNGALSIAPDGTIFVVVGYYNNPAAPIYSISGTDQPMPPLVAPFDSLTANYWVKVGTANADGSARSLILLDNVTLETVDVADTSQRTPLATNIGAGVTGTDACMYPNSADVVYRLAPTSGACDFATTNPSPALALSPRIASPSPAQGSSQMLTATFSNVVVPAGTPVYFTIVGANAQTQLVRSGSGGIATLSYQGTFTGNDVVTAFATIDGATLTSNSARVSWSQGPHASFLEISGPGGATAGHPVTLSASLVDIAVQPQAAIAGASLHFAVGGQSCDATTASNGTASCSVTLANPGAYTLTVSYAGNTQHLAVSESTLFTVPSDGIDRIFADGFDGN